MNNDKRRYSRLRVSMPLEVTSSRTGTAEMVIADLSDGGVFLMAEPRQCPPVGEKVTLRVVETLGGESPEEIPARVVRVTTDGMGLEYL